MPARNKDIVVLNDLSKTVSSLSLDMWSTSSHELQGIRIEKPDERHKSLILINAYMHPSSCTTGASLEFPWRDGRRTGWHSHFNTQSSLGDWHGASQQGCALVEVLSDVLFTPCVDSKSHTPWCVTGWHRQYNRPGTGFPKAGTTDTSRNPHLTKEWPHSLQSAETRDWAKMETSISVQVC